MNDLATLERPGDVTIYDPTEAQGRMAKTDAIIAYAKRVKDWPLLERAANEKIDELKEFVGWWEANVSVRQSPGTNQWSHAEQRSTISVEQAEKDTGFSQQQVSRIRKAVRDPRRLHDQIVAAGYKKGFRDTADVIAGKHTGDPESYTPSIYVDAAREVMGSIDLDPASNEIAQETINAGHWYGIQDDGLTKPWKGTVWLNPPYQQPDCANFVQKLCDDYRSGAVTQAVLLTNNNTDTRWWHQAARTAAAICLTLGRINFYKADGETTQPTNGQSFFYFGQDIDGFQRVFSEYGVIVTWLGGECR